MGETALSTSPAVPKLPAAETTLDLPIAYDRWMTHGANRAGLLLGLAPVAMLVAVFLMVASVEGLCGYSDGCATFLGSFWTLVLYVLGIAAILSIATLLARTRALTRDAVARFAPRLQSYKDWYLRGDVTEGEFEQLRGLVEPVAAGDSPGVNAEKALRVARNFCLIVSPLATILVVATVIIFAEFEGDLFFALVAVFAMDVVTAWLLVSGWRTVYRGRHLAKALQEDLVRRIDALENEILRLAHARKRPGGAPVSPYAAMGPSFRAFTGR